jgi:hypothetical protein
MRSTHPRGSGPSRSLVRVVRRGRRVDQEAKWRRHAKTTDIEQCGPSRQSLQAMIKRRALNASAARPSNAPRGARSTTRSYCTTTARLPRGLTDRDRRHRRCQSPSRTGPDGPHRCSLVRDGRRGNLATMCAPCEWWPRRLLVVSCGKRVQAHISVTLHRQRCAQLAAAMSTVPLRSWRSAR